MSHRWQYEDEYLRLDYTFRQAQRLGDMDRLAVLRPRLVELNGMLWQATIVNLPELSPYKSVIDAIQATAQRLQLTIPSFTDTAYEYNDGLFELVVRHASRTIQIWPRGSQGWYAVDIFAYDDDGTEYCYLGQTPSLMEATKALSYWISLQWSIEMLHAACPWISKDPFHHEGSRISFE